MRCDGNLYNNTLNNPVMNKQALLILLPLIIVGFFTAVIPIAGLIFYFTVLAVIYFYTRPRISFYLALLIAPLSNVALMYNSPLRQQNEVFSLIFIPVVLTLIMLIVSKISERTWRHFNYPDVTSGILFLYLGWTVISYLWTVDVYHGINKIYSMTLCVALYFLILIFVKDKESLEKVFKILMIWGIILGALFFISNKMEINKLNIKLSDNLSFFLQVITQGDRPGGFQVPQVASNVFGFLFFLGIALYPKARKSVKILIFFLGLFIISNLLAAGSKGGLGAFLIGFFFFLILYPGLRKKFILATFTFLLSFTSVFVFNIVVLRSDRLVKGAGVAIASFSSRLGFWEEGFKMLSNRWFGAGTGGFDVIIAPVPNAHSFYFSILFDLGVVGLFLFLIFICLILLKFKKEMVLVKDKDVRRYLYCMFSVMIMFLVHATIEIKYDNLYAWMLIGTVMAVINVAEKQRTLSIKRQDTELLNRVCL